MEFGIDVQSDSPIRVLRLTVWQDGVALGSRHTPDFTKSNQVRATFDWSFQVFGDGGYLPPGTRGEYTWHIEDERGNSYDTARERYQVEDNTQKWSVLSNDDLTVRWHAGNAAFGQAIFDRAVAAHAFLENEVGIDSADALEIFIYADKQEFFNALPAFSAEWTGGRMFPEYGVIMINFAPSQLEWGLRATSHELESRDPPRQNSRHDWADSPSRIGSMRAWRSITRPTITPPTNSLKRHSNPPFAATR